MNEPALSKSHELQETIISIEWNGDAKNALFSTLVENDAIIRIFTKEGDLKWTLEGHQAPVKAATWCAPEILVSVSADGELRQWTLRGSKHDCVKARSTAPNVVSMAPLPMTTRNAPPRCALLQSDGMISIIEPQKGLLAQKAFLGCAGMLPCENEGGLHVITQEGGRINHVQVDGTLQETGQRVSRDASFSIKKLQFVKDAGNIVGIMLIDDEGKLISWNVNDNKMHVLEDLKDASSAFIDHSTSTLFVGTKNGTVRCYPVRKNLSIGEKLFSIDAHDFQVTSVHASSMHLKLVSGSMDGILVFHDLARDAFQVIKDGEQKPGIDWRESERLENKLHLAEDLIEKRQFDRASEVLSEVEGMPGASQNEVIDRIKAKLAIAISKKESESEKHQKLLSYLERVARDRGDILLAEICKDLGITKQDLVRTIKSLDEEMDWEFVEKYECLFLFKRERAITSMPVLEHRHAERHDRRSNDRREYQPQKQRRTLLHRDPRYHPMRDANDHRAAKPPMTKGQVPGGIVKAIATVKDCMKAAFLDNNGNVMQQVAVPDLIRELEGSTKKIAYILTDGIVSPRLVEQSERSGVKGIIGRRLHPNVDPRKTTARVMEFDEIDTSAVVEMGPDPRQPRKESEPGKIEQSIINVLEFDKWKTSDQVMAALEITDSIEQQVIMIKLKQLVTTRAIQTEMHEGKQYFKRVKEQDR
nr:hypothetical protein [Candidatus Sigynarchaeota archaeon]